MPERDLSEAPAEERLTLAQAASLLGRSTKAIQQLVQRGSLDYAREDVNPQTGRARRVWTTRAWVEEYARSAGLALREPEVHEPGLEQRVAVGVLEPATEQRASEYWQQVAEELADENLRFRLRVAELEAALRSRG